MGPASTAPPVRSTYSALYPYRAAKISLAFSSDVSGVNPSHLIFFMDLSSSCIYALPSVRPATRLLRFTHTNYQTPKIACLLEPLVSFAADIAADIAADMPLTCR